jgi:hypothetical protein
MKVSFLYAALFSIAVGAALAVWGPAGAQAQQNVCQTNPSPVDSADPSIIVSEPTAGDSTASPVHVEGQARVFEANVSLKLFDASGTELVSTFTTAAEGQTLSPFSTDVAFSVTSTTQACLWVFETSAQDGRPVNVVQIPLTLEAAGLPATGTGGGAASDAPPTWHLAMLAFAGMVLVGAGLLTRRRQT